MMEKTTGFVTTKRISIRGEEEEIPFEDLRAGDKFKLYSNDDCKGPFIARDDPMPCFPEGNWIISCDRLH